MEMVLTGYIEKISILSAHGLDTLEFPFIGDYLVGIYFQAYGNETLITFAQKNIPTRAKVKIAIRLGFDRGWSL